MDASEKNAVSLQSGGNVYRVWIDSLCYQRLLSGLLFAPKDYVNEKVPEYIQKFQDSVNEMWPSADDGWMMLTPFSELADSDLLAKELQGHEFQEYPDLLLCAAVLHSDDELSSADEYEYDSFAHVIWTQQAHEPMPPGHVLELIDWEKIARNRG